MISVRNLQKNLSTAKETLTLESSKGWFPGGRSRDRPMRADEALKISAFYRAVDIRSDSISRLPVTVKDMTTRREVQDHYLGRVLWERPNEAMVPSIYKKLVEYQRLVLGNSYVWIYRDGHGHPVELLPLPPGTCHPYLDPGSGKLWYIAQNPKTHELYRLAPEDILHYKGFTTDGIVGRSLLSQAARTLRVAESRDSYELDIYQNGGRPSGVLTTETDLSAKQDVMLPNGEKGSYQDYIRYQWEKIHTGPGNGMRVAVLDNSLEYKPIAMSFTDAQFVESKSVSVEDISRFTGVPLHLLSAGKQSYESNSANGIEYVKYTLQPPVTQYEEEDSRKLLTVSDRNRRLWLPRNMMAELRGDIASRKEWYKALREIGAMSANEIRQLEDLPDVEGGDDLYASLNFVPLRIWATLSKIRALPDGDGELNKKLEEVLQMLLKMKGDETVEQA